MTLTASRLPDGKFSVRSGTSQIDAVILADQVLELRIRGQLFHALRKPKATDAYSRLEDLGRAEKMADDIWCDAVTPAERYAVTRRDAVTWRGVTLSQARSGRAFCRYARLKRRYTKKLKRRHAS